MIYLRIKIKGEKKRSDVRLTDILQAIEHNQLSAENDAIRIKDVDYEWSSISWPVNNIPGYAIHRSVINSLLPNAPAADGTYTLQLTVEDGKENYKWVKIK